MNQSKTFISVIFSLFLVHFAIAQEKAPAFLFGDALPDAPELSARGPHDIGVRTMEIINKDQIDVVNSKDGVDPKYDRKLTIEIWYPADLPEGTEALVTYDEVLGMSGNPERPNIPFQFQGRASRDAKVKKDPNLYPLIVLSHGYVGSRYIMSYLAENLASKGYIVVAIDHTESTFADSGPFQSTLLNRSKDILFVIKQMTEWSHLKTGNFLAGYMDTNTIGIAGYSMGGYGVLNVAGAGYSDGAAQFFKGMTKGSDALAIRTANHPDYLRTVDDRIKAVVAFAPWGMVQKVWDLDGLKGLKKPTLFIAGSQDDISGYELGIKAIYEGAVNADRYLLTYKNARHNVAGNPPPPESLKPGLHIDEYYRYAEPSWDARRINNINQHFVTAFFGMHLKGEAYGKFLSIQENSNEKDWTGFKPRSSTGLELLHAKPAE